ncbi:hypothetical protein Pint_25866 [Pistacia integerrima]|uniref:Uncharacterized protein n=1 Tax=Pistacia integerrima TaxID=434235 RepID=A0ACC0YAY5_9ROSI|nr:hypothetical protein Pint_25866 [Pistacia integerrima]
MFNCVSKSPPSEALTRIIESDQEVATVDKTTEVRNLLVEETADEPAMELAPGLAPISSTFQDQDSAASVQPTTPPLTMISLLNLASSVPSTHLESEVMQGSSLQNMRICLMILLRLYQGVHSSQQ